MLDLQKELNIIIDRAAEYDCTLTRINLSRYSMGIEFESRSFDLTKQNEVIMSLVKDLEKVYVHEFRCQKRSSYSMKDRNRLYELEIRLKRKE